MAMTDRQKGLMDELMDELSSADGGVMSGSFINEIKGIMDGIKGLGIGDRGLNTPAERDYLKGVMDTTSDWTFDVDGKTEDYTFTGDAMPSEMAVQKMRDAHGITAEVPFEANTNVMFTPAQREFIDSLPEPIRLRVEEHRATLPPEKFQELINGMMEGVIPEGAVWENAGANLGANAGFQQYNRGTAIPNLGFAGYSQG